MSNDDDIRKRAEVIEGMGSSESVIIDVLIITFIILGSLGGLAIHTWYF